MTNKFVIATIVFMVICTAAVVTILVINPNTVDNKNPSGCTDISETSTTADGLVILKQNTCPNGKEVKSGDTISINYTGYLQDGTKFDSSIDKGTPFETQIGVGAVIKGWDEGVVGMKVGEKRHLTIPPALGYGSTANGPIPANSTLIFDVELISIK